jgi:hypothetical protein
MNLRCFTAAQSAIGFLIPALIDDRNTLIAGHARIEAAEICGLKTVPCVRASHLSEAQKRAFAIVDNRLSQGRRLGFSGVGEGIRFFAHTKV